MLYPIDMTLGNRIKRARARLIPKLTQREIADAFGISDKAVSAWERDDTIPERDKLARLALMLHVPVIWLLEGVGEPPPPDDLDSLVETLSPTERAAVIAVIHAMRRQAGRVA